MTKIILNGCKGKMGLVISDIVSQRTDCKIVAGIGTSEDMSGTFPIFDSIEKIETGADVIIDFSNPSALEPLLHYSCINKIPIVICTTGFSKTQADEIKKASRTTPVFYSGNMSMGINLLTLLVKRATTALGDNFDIEIVEKHHNQKIDAPSGTAMMIADAISSELNEEPNYIYDRHSYRRKRGKNEIGIHSIRGGTIVGEHEVVFAGEDEIIKISHIAGSKKIFAIGAVNSAIFLKDKPAGLYSMENLLDV